MTRAARATAPPYSAICACQVHLYRLLAKGCLNRLRWQRSSARLALPTEVHGWKNWLVAGLALALGIAVSAALLIFGNPARDEIEVYAAAHDISAGTAL